MKIGIDARLINETGVGRYIISLLQYLPSLNSDNLYTVFLLPKDFDNFTLPNPHWQKKIAGCKWHTLKEQLMMPLVLNKEALDLVHFPYFNVPLFYRKKFIVTIHDLTILKLATGKATTKIWPVYLIKRFGFNLALRHAIYNSAKIIAVSNTVKNEIIDKFKIDKDKIAVTYESGEIEDNKPFFNGQTHIINGLKYLLYVGNAHPHKNLDKLIQAFSLLLEKEPLIKLVLVGDDGFFYQRLKNQVRSSNLSKNIIFTGKLNNYDLKEYYKNALAFVFPSLSEGFGIPGLEAMNYNCPVIASDIPVFKEIYKDAALYFNPNSAKDIVRCISSVLGDPAKRKIMIEKGLKRAHEESWEKMARETLSLYLSVDK